MSELDLSPQQRWSWLHGGERGVFAAQAAFAVRGELDAGRLRRAARRVAERHEILRTSFERPGWSKVPKPRVGAAAEPAWERLETDLDAGELLAARRRRDFDPATGPSFSLTLTGGPGRPLLVVELSALAADDRTLELLLAELARAWSEEGADPEEDPAAEDGPLQYGDFAAWQNDLVAQPDEAGELARAFWARHDLGASARLRLPGEGEAGAVGPFSPRAVPVPVTAATRRRLDRLAEAGPGPLPILLHAVFEALLWHRLRAPGLVLGRLFDGRKFADLEAGLGPFARMLPVLSSARGDRPFSEWVRRAGEAIREAAGWQEYAWGELGEPEPGGGPRFPFVSEHGVRRRISLAPGLTLEPVARFVCAEPFTLRLSSWDDGDGRANEAFGAELAWDAARLPESTGRMLAAELATLLAQAAATPERPLAELSLLAPPARHRVLVELNDTRRPEPTAGTGGAPVLVHERIAAQARRAPEAPAVVYEGRALAYGELLQRAHRLAHRLRRLGVGPESRVALYLERSPEAVVAMVATLAAGGAYLPLDPAFPRERLARMLADAAPVVVLTLEAVADRVREHGVPVLCLDGEGAALDGDPEAPPAVATAPENLAYLLFTSGSTGRPKGVAVEHRQLLAYLDAIVAELAPPPGASFGLVSTLAADLGNTVLWPALTTGGCLHVIDPDRASSPQRLAESFHRHPIDYLKIVPSHLAALAAAVEPTALRPRRRLILGGEAASWELAERFAEGEGGGLLNHYGPTEATVGVTTAAVDPASLRPGGGTWRGAALPLGRPLPGCRVYVADGGLAPVPPGAAGELLLAGDQLARGYLGRPAATAERFIPDPFTGPSRGGLPGGRLYRSGDRVRLLPDGRLDFLGRVDQQVKIRGFRIELGEIEAALLAHPGLAQAAVLVRQDEPGEERLVAYGVAAAGRPAPDLAELQTFLAPKLPAYMLPAALVVLPALPITPNGKLDRAALPAPERGPVTQRPYVAPRSEVEATLAGIWEQVLGVERVGVDDNFFALGGDSIVVIQVVARAHQARLRFKPRDLFQRQTIAELATVVEAAAGVVEEEGLPEDLLPLTPIQEWFFAQGFEEPEHWNQALLLEARPFEREPLAAALAALAGHHDALRLRFESTPEGWRQRYAEPPGGETAELFPLTWIDLGSSADGELPAAVEAAAGRLQTGFDLQRGPLAGAIYFDLGPGRPGRLLLAAHHLVVDGVSWRILLADLVQAHDQLAGGAAPSLPAKSTSYGRWAQRLAAETAAGRFDDELPWWLQAAATAARVPPLPLDLAGGEEREASSDRVEVALDAEETASLLGEVHAAYRTEINDLLLAALALAVHGWTGAPVVAVELEGHGREEWVEDVDTSRTVGWFTSRFPVYLEVPAGSGGEPRSESVPPAMEWTAIVLPAIKEQLRRVPQRGFGFGALRHLRGGEVAAELAALPRPELAFNYLGQLDRALSPGGSGGAGAVPPLRPAGEPTGPAHSPRARRGHRLSVTARVVDGRLVTAWSYGREVHRRETVERVAELFVGALRRLIDHCRQAEPGGFTPSDFELVDLDQGQLEAIAAKVRSSKG